MVKWLLDTNVLSELMKPEPDEKLLAWLEQNDEGCALSVVTIGEISLGIERLPQSKRRHELQKAFKFLREDFAGRILDFTEGVSIEWARLVAEGLKVGRRLPVIDSQIEATGAHYGLIVVTRNSADFLRPTFNPWHP